MNRDDRFWNKLEKARKELMSDGEKDFSLPVPAALKAMYEEKLNKLLMKTKMVTFRIKRSPRTKQFRCVVVAGNGEVILTGEPCNNRRDVEKMILNLFWAFAEERIKTVDETFLKKTNDAIAELMADKPPKKPKHYEGKLNRSWP